MYNEANWYSFITIEFLSFFLPDTVLPFTSSNVLSDSRVSMYWQKINRPTDAIIFSWWETPLMNINKHLYPSDPFLTTYSSFFLLRFLCILLMYIFIIETFDLIHFSVWWWWRDIEKSLIFYSIDPKRYSNIWVIICTRKWHHLSWRRRF
jgi:hypothetical protein